MKTKDIDLVKIIDEVWKENELHSGTYKVAALTAMQKLQDLYEGKRTEQQQSDEKCTLPVVTASAFVDKIAPMAEYVQGKHYKHEYKKLMIPVIEYNELKEAAKQFDNEH